MPTFFASIAARLQAVGFAVAVTLVAMIAVGWYDSSRQHHAASEARTLHDDVETLADMRLAAARMILAAMDSIIDREAGDISTERLDIVNNAARRLADGLPAVTRIGVLLGRQADVEEIARGVSALPKVITHDMRDLIRAKAEASAFDAIDDKIDDAGAEMMDLMDALADKAGQRLTADLDLTERLARDLWLHLSTVAGLGLVVIVPLLLAVIRSVTRRLKVLGGCMTALAGGDLAVEVADRDKPDEIGAMARSVVVFRDAAREARHLSEARDRDRAETERRRAEVQHLVAEFRAKVGDVLADVGRESMRFAETARTLGQVAATASREIGTVSEASREASHNVQGVASAAEQLAASVAEIGRRVDGTGQVVGRAADEAIAAQTEIESLARSAREIGEVVTLIDSIADQTNLLALNATIEAARAGEAGRGFAIVAAEVKQLAGETAKATQNIGQRVAEIQTTTARAVEAITLISRSMTDVRDNTTAIAAGVGQQGSATGEISRSIQGAASGTESVARSIADVSGTARAADASAEAVLAGSRTMADRVEDLKRTVDAFVRSVAAA